MRNNQIYIWAIVFVFSACMNKPHGSAHSILVHGSIKHFTQPTMTLMYRSSQQSNEDPTSKLISIDKEGHFCDTIDGNNRMLYFNYKGNNIAFVGKEGAEIGIDFDEDDIVHTLSFSGTRWGSNNFNYKAGLLIDSIRKGKLLTSLNYDDFVIKRDSLNQILCRCLEENKAGMKVEEYNDNKENISHFFLGITQSRKQVDLYRPGVPSPVFNNYINFAGGKTALSEFMGHYVLIYLWVTWDNSCKYEFSFLKKMEEKYKNSNVAFVAISLDMPQDELKWRKYIKDHLLGGKQLMATHASTTDFPKAYNVASIPRVIFIDPQGNIVNANAPRPSMQNEFEKMMSVVK